MGDEAKKDPNETATAEFEDWHAKSGNCLAKSIQKDAWMAARQLPTPRELVAIVGDEIVIRVPLDAIPVAAAVAWETRSLRELKVTDIPVFAVEIVRQLRREKENGETLVTDMLDAAVIRAVEDGAEGFELGESPV